MVGLAIDATVERHQAQRIGHPNSGDESDTDEFDITMRHVVNCAVSTGWQLSTTVDNAESGDARVLVHIGVTDTISMNQYRISRCCGGSSGGYLSMPSLSELHYANFSPGSPTRRRT